MGRGNSRKAFFFFIFVALLFALVEALGSRLPGQISAFEIVWARYGIHLLILGAVCVPFGLKRLVRTARPYLQVGRSLTMLGMPVFFILAAQRMPLSRIWSIFWMTILLAMLLSALFLGERPAWEAVILAGAGWLGGVLIFRPALTPPGWADVLPAGMALCFSLYLVASRELRAEDIFASLFYTALGVFVPLSLLLPRVWQPLSVRSFLILGLIAFLGLILLYLIDRAAELVPVANLSLLLLTQPLWVVVMELPGGGAQLGLRSLAGSGILLAVAFFAYLLFVQRGRIHTPRIGPEPFHKV
jgi:drug/metabolite transporter (DMT)-like permease